MTIQGKITARDLDQEHYSATRDTDHKDLLVHAARVSGHPVLQIQRDFRQLAKTAGRLNMAEYVRYGLYRSEDFGPGEREAFLSNDLHWDICHSCNNRNWTALSEDKVLAMMMLAAGGVPVPQALGVIDTTPRIFPDLAKISTADALHDLLTREPGGAFGKIIDGMVSLGAFRVDSADQTHIHCAGHAPMTYDQFLGDFIGGKSHVLQRIMTNHDTLRPYATALATVRMVNMVTDEGVFTPAAAIKLPQGSNIADNFWRTGNLLCDVDIETGTIRGVAEQAGLDIIRHADHPAAPGLMGLVLPHWDKLIEVNARAARLYAPVRYQSADIAITQDGPVVVELNYGGAFDLPQFASGRGLLTPEVRAFFETHGYAFGAAQKKRGWFGRSG